MLYPACHRTEDASRAGVLYEGSARKGGRVERPATASSGSKSRALKIALTRHVLILRPGSRDAFPGSPIHDFPHTRLAPTTLTPRQRRRRHNHQQRVTQQERYISTTSVGIPLTCQIRPQGYGGGQGEPVPDSIGDSPTSPDTPTRPILGTEEVIEVARGE